MSYNLSEIKEQFQIKAETVPYGNGHINDTFIIEGEEKYILQRVNTGIFKNPDKLMENVLAVTEFLKEKIKKEGGNPERETLTVIKTRDGKPCYCPDSETCFRMYKFIEGATAYDSADDPKKLYHAAKAFGKFQKMLADFPAENLFETIEKFHDTRDRFNQFKKAVAEDKCGRAKLVEEEIAFLLERESDADVVLSAIAEGSVPVRVTHNDTKLNNVMLDDKTGEGVCVIDLDTVMPGSLLYDFGDALRFAGASGAEDETDLSKIWFDLEKYEWFTKGFLDELKSVLTEREKELLPFSVKLLTYENALRFLTDHLNGDIYFKIHRGNHNLDRARTQMKLVADIETKMDRMEKITEKYL